MTQPGAIDYALLDSGHGRKLERLGRVVTDRPEPQAIWSPRLPGAEWHKADAVFTGADDESGEGNGRWQVKDGTPQTWPVTYDGLAFHGRLTPFRHLGCFPDQAPHWDMLRAHIKPGMKMLNLFGYTGVASLVAARAGAEVVHVDASKKAIGFGKENAELAGLQNKPIRWLTDDALAFARREVRRGNKYHVILLDPPKFGRGPDGEKWEFFDHVPELLAAVAQLTEEQNSLAILTAYALRASAVAMESALKDAYANTGAFTHGDLTVTDAAGRAFSTALWAKRTS